MSNISDRQTVIISVNLASFVPAVPNVSPEVPSQVNIPINLRFAAEELIIKSIAYNPLHGTNDIESTVQIWCNLTYDGLIASFTNTTIVQVQHNEHFKINNTFQSGNLTLQFQGTDGSINNVPNFGNPWSYNPQRLISNQSPQRTFGTVVLTIEFVKYEK